MVKAQIVAQFALTLSTKGSNSVCLNKIILQYFIYAVTADSQYTVDSNSAKFNFT